MKNSPEQPKMAGDPTFSFYLRLYNGGTLVATKLFQFSTDRTGARLEGVPAEKYCFPIGPHT